MHDVVQKAQRIVAADRARCRLDRINAPASGAPLALTGQRGHDAPRAEVRCGQQERHAKTTSAASDAEPGRPGPGRHRRSGPLVISRGSTPAATDARRRTSTTRGESVTGARSRNVLISTARPRSLAIFLDASPIWVMSSLRRAGSGCRVSTVNFARPGTTFTCDGSTTIVPTVATAGWPIRTAASAIPSAIADAPRNASRRRSIAIAPA